MERLRELSNKYWHLLAVWYILAFKLDFHFHVGH